MRFGLVRFVNARPLDLGLKENTDGHTLIEATPAELFTLLQSKELDAALISSVECLRNRETLDTCMTVGICALHQVTSILYLAPSLSSRPETIFADNGSRTSVALLQLLFQLEYGYLPRMVPTPPETVIKKVANNEGGGLLIGDAALRFYYASRSTPIEVRDLAEWWYSRERLPFVFALWAYPKERPVDHSIFERSCDYGMEHIESIVEHSDMPHVREYLTRTLHYRLTDDDHKSLERFNSLLSETDLL